MLLDRGLYQGSDTDTEADDNYSYQSVNAGQDIDPDPDLYDSALDYQIPADEDSEYESANEADFNNPEYEKRRKIDRAKEILNRRSGGPERERKKQIARDLVKDKLGKRIGNQGLKQGFEKGLSKSAGSLVKEGAGKAVKAGAEKLAGTAAKQAATQVGKQALSKGAGTAVAGATGIETLGLGVIIGFLINIALSLYLDDALKALDELKQGNKSEALFLFIVAGSKVGVFIYLLIAIVLMFTVVGLVISIPILIGLNAYMVLSAIPAFKAIPYFNGLVWWEVAILIVIDMFALIIVAGFIGGIGYYLCEVTGIGQTTLTGAAVSIYGWWSGDAAAGFVNEFCKFAKSTPGS